MSVFKPGIFELETETGSVLLAQLHFFQDLFPGESISYLYSPTFLIFNLIFCVKRTVLFLILVILDTVPKYTSSELSPGMFL